jgi:spermidine synthase
MMKKMPYSCKLLARIPALAKFTSGLGAGTAPKAFVQHGLNVTVVELDPKVHEYATKYFNFPEDHNAVIGDAVEWASKYSKEHPESFDYIIHDVFTGGAEPTQLFTLEFLQQLSALLKEDGAIAINFAGDITMPPTKIVFNTIAKVFPTCRVYRDTPPYEEESFLNMVVYCTKLNAKIEWRATTNEDYLGSMARRAFMPPDEGYELELPKIFGERKYLASDILTRANETALEEFRLDSALRHWKIMRTVLPDKVWENW